jgi:hypothetical protein
MAFKIRKHGSVIASFAAPQEIIISHTNDSIDIGDGTNLFGPLEDVGGVFCFPVAIKSIAAGTLATAANQTDGSQKTKIVNGADTVEVDDVGGEKALKVSVISTVGGAGSGTASTDGAAYTAGTSAFTPIGGAYDDVASDALAEGEMGMVRLTADRGLHVHLASGASTLATAAKQDTLIGHVDGLEALITATNALLTTMDADTGNISTKIDTLAGAVAGTEMQVDVLTSALPTGAATEATLASILADTATIDSQTLAIKTAVEILDNCVAGSEMQVDVLTMPVVAVTGTFWQATQPISGTVTASNNTGNVAHDSAVSGNPVRVAGRAMLANGTAVAEDDVCDMATDNQGRTIVTPHAPRDLIVQAAVTQASTTEATFLAAGAAGVFHDVTKFVFTNSDTTTATRVQIRDATAGSVMLEVALAAGGGAVIDFGSVPMKQTTAANNWTIDLSGAVTSVYAFIQAVKRIA